MTANLLDFDLEGLAVFCEGLGEKRFRATQLYRWIHQKGASDFTQMTDLAKSLREKLATTAHIEGLKVLTEQKSSDGTIKWLFDVGNCEAVEAVYIPEADRGTLCVSSQAGCAVGCRFCSTGHQGFSRNLTSGEIIAQLWFAEHTLRRLANDGKGTDERIISNVVMMGMGEPLANFDNVTEAMDIMLDDHGYGLSRRRVTLSTSGIVPNLIRLKTRCPVALAVSLHAPNDKLRDVLVPINQKYPLAVLLAAIRDYLEAAPRDFVTFEYVMLSGVNDAVAHAQELVSLVEDLPCKFNLIPWNVFPGAPYQRSSNNAIQRFREVLQTAGFIVTVRKTRGDDIDAACGQLAGQVVDKSQRVSTIKIRQQDTKPTPSHRLTAA